MFVVGVGSQSVSQPATQSVRYREQDRIPGEYLAALWSVLSDVSPAQVIAVCERGRREQKEKKIGTSVTAHSLGSIPPKPKHRG